MLCIAAFLLVGTRQSYVVPYTGLGQSPSQMLFLLLGVVWLLTRLTGSRGVAGLTGWRVAVAFTAITGVASYVAGLLPGLAGDRLAATDTSLLRLLSAAAAAVAVLEAVRTRRQLEVIVQAVVAGGALSGLYALVQFGTGIDLAARLAFPGLRQLADTGAVALLRDGVTRPQGAAGAPLELGAVMTMLLPLALVLVVAARRSGRRWWPWALAAAVIGAAGAASLSRSVFVGATVAVLVLFAKWPLKWLAAALAMLGVGVGLAALAGVGLVGPVVTLLITGSQDYSLQSRAEGRAYVAKAVLQHFWFGQGLGTYQLGPQPVLDNQYLSQLVESGLVGMVALVALLVAAFVVARQARARQPDPAAAELAAGISATLAVVAVVDLVLDTSGFAQVSLLTWLLIGLAAAAGRVALISRTEAGSGRTGSGRADSEEAEGHSIPDARVALTPRESD